MKIWVHINGVQEGPYDESSLPLDRMTEDTPVWYEGLEYWQPAGMAQLTAPLFARKSEMQPTAPSRQNTDSYRNEAYNSTASEARPKSYLIWSIILTLICCNPVGIVPIILGASVNTKLNNYDLEGARRASETTEWWLMITIVTSLIFGPMTTLLSLM